MKYQYRLLITFAEEISSITGTFTSNTPVAIGHTILWRWSKKPSYEPMTLKVEDIIHEDGKTDLYCVYDDCYGDASLTSVLVELGMSEKDAAEDAKWVSEMRKERGDRYGHAMDIAKAFVQKVVYG